MELTVQNYEAYAEEIEALAKRYDLDVRNLKVDFFTPKCQAIVTERVCDHLFKVHINLEQDRIISIKTLTNAQNGELERIKDKYRKFMK